MTALRPLNPFRRRSLWTGSRSLLLVIGVLAAVCGSCVSDVGTALPVSAATSHLRSLETMCEMMLRTFDINSNGMISVSELKQIFLRFDITTVDTDEDLQTHFLLGSAEEQVSALCLTMKHESLLQIHLLSMFSHLSGFSSEMNSHVMDIGALQSKLPATMTADELRPILDELNGCDTNHDGRLTYEELSTCYTFADASKTVLLEITASSVNEPISADSIPTAPQAIPATEGESSPPLDVPLPHDAASVDESARQSSADPVVPDAKDSVESGEGLKHDGTASSTSTSTQENSPVSSPPSESDKPTVPENLVKALKYLRHREYASAVEELDQYLLGATEPYPDALYHRARLHLYGLPSNFAPDRAFAMFTDCSDRFGHPGCQFYLAMMYEHGYHVPVNHTRALIYLHFASRGGDVRAQLSLGYRYTNGFHVPRSCSAALEQYRRAAEIGGAEFIASGNIPPHIRKSRLSSESDLQRRQTEEQVIEFYEYSAEIGGSPTVLISLGLHYLQGRGENFAEATILYDEALQAAVGAADAKVDTTASSSGTGTGTSEPSASTEVDESDASDDEDDVTASTTSPSDIRRAIGYFRRAMKAGEATSLGHLGRIYSLGQGGIPKDPAMALKYFKRGAEKNDALSLTGLGYHYLYGIGVPESAKDALSYFQRAVERGSSEAHYYLGEIHMKGLAGVAQNFERAQQYFSVASRQNHILANLNLGTLYASAMGTKESCPLASSFFRTVSERSRVAASVLNEAIALYEDSHERASIIEYEIAGDMGFETAQFNAAYLYELSSDPELINNDDVVADAVDGADQSSATEQSTAPRVQDLLRGREAANLTRWDRAFYWYTHSAAQNHRDSLVKLGDFYFAGEGTEQDFVAGSEAYRTAGDMKSDQALFSLGWAHLVGRGLPRDFFLAKRYFDLAVEANPEAVIPSTVAVWLITGIRHWEEIQERGLWDALTDSRIVWDNPDKGQAGPPPGQPHTVKIGQQTVVMQGSSSASTEWNWKSWWENFTNKNVFMNMVKNTGGLEDMLYNLLFLLIPAMVYMNIVRRRVVQPPQQRP